MLKSAPIVCFTLAILFLIVTIFLPAVPLWVSVGFVIGGCLAREVQ